jgi:hypothetical protein
LRLEVVLAGTAEDAKRRRVSFGSVAALSAEQSPGFPAQDAASCVAERLTKMVHGTFQDDVNLMAQLPRCPSPPAGRLDRFLREACPSSADSPTVFVMEVLYTDAVMNRQ